MMTGSEIRKRFLDYFARHGHTVVPSSGLIPQNDPTLLFTNAGMVQFKGVFLGDERRSYTRAASSQKCVRAGGKHNDLENVGRTARHHTFFEMLGNFSFGDYFKKEAIPLAWTLVTEELGLPPDRLMATVYADDDEAHAIWRRTVGLPEERVVRIPTSDNFWSMGDTGPCGPCSEIFFDHGPGVAGGPPGSEQADGDRFVEIWNLVFMQYNRDAAGQLTPLPNPCIDTGAGLERIAAIQQGVHSNFDSDLFTPVLHEAARLAGRRYGEDGKRDVSLRVIADHLRAMGFLISDGVLPANAGRGYVLRRIMRRAMRHGRLLGLEEPFLHHLLPTLILTMGEAYPQLTGQKAMTALVVEQEEKRFAATLGVGLKLLEEALEKLDSSRVLPGETVFTLYDTYGFPVDLTADIVRERGVVLDLEGFQERMAEQRKRARAAWAGSGEEAVKALYHDLVERHGGCEFLGYVSESAQGEILSLLTGTGEVAALSQGEEGWILTNQTPFYGESGGQVGDTGIIATATARFEVVASEKPLPDLILHRGRVVTGTFLPGEMAQLQVDGTRRRQIRLHHSATHFLHHALRLVLGDHVKQAGSLVAPERLRFDFAHFQALGREEMARVEELVNGWILDNHAQETLVMSQEAAVEAGAMALFGEKYGDEVRVVRLGPSMELCGGTHVSRSGDIGLFKILSESAVAAGVRRIEGVCGPAARQLLWRQEEELKSAAELLRLRPDEVAQGVRRLQERIRELEKEMEKAHSARAGNLVEELASRAVAVRGVRVVAEKLDGFDPKGLRELVDRLKDRMGREAIFLLAVAEEGKASLIAGATRDVAERLPAGELMKFAAAMVGGKGGGRPDMAQGGGTDPSRLPQVLGQVTAWVEERLP